MKTPFDILSERKNEKGVAAVYVAIMLAVFIGITALAVDVGYLMVSRNELQNAADASALAATRQLGAIYEPMSYEAQQTYICNPGDIITVAQSAALSNKAAGEVVTVQGGDGLSGDVIIGKWEGADKTLTPTLSQPDAVRVTTRRDPSVAAGQISTFFARIFGIDKVSVSATATAALSAIATANLADMELPVGISKVWFERGVFCGESIHFYPTDSCAGWTDFSTKKGKYDPGSSSVNDIDVRTLIDDIRLHNFPYAGMPTQIQAGATQFPFIGGTLSTPTFDAMEKLFNSRKTCCDNNGNFYWDTLVVVYDRPGDTPASCGNPNDLYTIVGFAKIRLREVVGAAGKYLEGTVICGPLEPGRSGGGNYGTKGTIPGLVQ
jgi:hypothetical protein